VSGGGFNFSLLPDLLRAINSSALSRSSVTRRDEVAPEVDPPGPHLLQVVFRLGFVVIKPTQG
jgi:hypothetical protein